MSGGVSLLREIADLRAKLDEAKEENRQLREALTPACAFPFEWKLTVRQSQYLRVLMRGKGELITREAFLFSVYQDGLGGDTKVIDVVICQLRKKLSPFGVAIRTHWGEGYSLTAEALAILRAATQPAPIAA